ncbi:MAG: hypothetical protein ABI622_00250 [Chloroflexota bacterium]
MVDSNLLAQLLAYAALLAATIEYCELVKRRAVQRTVRLEARMAQEAGLRGLVRLFLADEAGHERAR